MKRFALLALVLAAALVPYTNTSAAFLGGLPSSMLRREPQLRPENLGNNGLSGLQFADATEQMVIMNPPDVSYQGGAELQHPLLIPAGRGGFQPKLSVDYNSAAGNSWLGAGWDLSVGEISIDTRWGVPRFDTAKESETYMIDGAVLSPTAVRSTWQNRVAERSDWTRRVETSYDLIIRHGDSPKNYWWEVRDKMGGIRWYGGFPDDGGPSVGVKSTAYTGCNGALPANQQPASCESLKQDPNSILFDDDGNAYRWMLTAQRDVGVNMIRYFYDKVSGQRVGAASETLGRQIYLRSILYTAAASASPAGAEDPAYEVRFIRDGGVTPAPTPRKDIMVDARGGFLQVTSDLLRRVEVWYGNPPAVRGPTRTYNILSRRYDLDYQEGAFGKTLLKSVKQIGSDGATYGTHEFDYFDEVRNAQGTYTGFSGETTWNTGTDNLQGNAIQPVNLSPLGSSETNSGDVHAYIGFNPALPTKDGSFGGAFTVRGGATEALAEMIDINGDGLPDKVFRESRGGPIYYRLNMSGPNRTPTFGPKNSVINLSKLSTEFSIGLAGSLEAYFGIYVQFQVAGDVTVGEDYFIDVNYDGLPDYVSAGTVFFNRLDSNGVPTFESSSANTEAPINATGSATIPPIQAITDIENQRRDQSPLQDTVRRWVAPWTGTIAITGAVTLEPPTVPGDPVPPYTGDGVRVAVQKNGGELWNATLTTPNASATPSGVGSIGVSKGDRIYFRVGSINDGARDQVRWNPTITYAASPPNDVNGLSQKVYNASADYTLAGRPGTVGMAPSQGTIRFEGTLKKTAVTSDDVTVQVVKNGTVIFSQVVPAATVNTTGIPLTQDFTVAAPTANSRDQIEVRISVDSPVDVTVLNLTHRLYYIAFVPAAPTTDSSGNPVAVLDVPANIDIYPEHTDANPRSPWTSDLGRAVTARASLSINGYTGRGGPVVVTIKTTAGVVAKQTITVPTNPSGQTFTTDIPITLANGTNYWFDFSIREPDISDRVTGSSVQLRWDDNGLQTRNVPSERNWAGRQNTFPISYRGWGYAGYDGNGNRATQAINEPDFVFDPNAFPQSQTEPTTFNDPNFPNAGAAKSYVYTPTRIDVRNAAGAVVSSFYAWRGSKDNLLGTADLMRSSRKGADNPSLGITGGAGVTAVRRVGVSGPIFSLSGGIGPLGGSFGVGPTFGLLDYMDLNGDGFPDIVAPGYVKYTNPRGGFAEEGSGVSVVNQDLTFAVGGGIGADGVEIMGNAKGDVASAQNTASVSGTNATATNGAAASSGESAAASEYGFNVGGSLGITATFVNPPSSSPDWSDALDKVPSVDRTAPMEMELADVNGDGLPDRVIMTPQGVYVKFNLGYKFATNEVRWAVGGFENNESYSGSVGASVGFRTPSRDFSGGLGLSESIDIARYVWVDVDGDGILDRLHKGSNGITVAFGNNSVLQNDVNYGTFASGTFDLFGGNIPVGEQIAVGRSRGVGAGADFTIGIGPLCLVACYIIVNPGVQFDHSISTTQIQLTDVDGDGYPDSVKSTADNQMLVRFNNRGRTNLLKRVRNPIGGSIRLDYKREGNTTALNQSVWTLASVEQDDGRPGDGVDVRLSTYEYSGGRYNRLEREMLGFSSVIERQRDFRNDGNVFDDPVLRTIERTFLNNNIFDSGLQTRQTLKSASGATLQETVNTWSLTDLATKTAASLAPTPADPANVRLLMMAVAPNVTKVEQRWFDSTGAIGQETWTTYEYNDLGDIVRQVDIGEPETPDDDLIATMVYTTCTNASDSASYEATAWACPAVAPSGGVPPYWNNQVCPTWTRLPGKLTITNGTGTVLRERDGLPALCDNSSVTDLREKFGPGANDFAQTLLSYDDWGSYAHIEYPQNAAGQRQIVDYVYDDVSAANVASTTDSFGLTATATFDGRTGRIASRTDSNGQVTTYTYDAFGRLATITGPFEQGTGKTTISFEYYPTAPAYAYAVAKHFDAKNPNDTIDTVTFVDGSGRRTQTKQDGAVFQGANSAPQNVMIVTSSGNTDALGRIVLTRYPVSEPLGTAGTFNTSTAGLATTLEWTVSDRQTKVTTPDNSVTQTAYDFGGAADFGAKLFKTTVTDPLGKPTTTWTDVNNSVIAVDDEAIGQTRIRTRFGYDPLGQLVKVTDNAGFISSYGYDLMGRGISAQTPNGGLVETRWDGASNIVSKTTPNLRRNTQQIAYEYQFDRLTKINYPDATPDVTYTYGAAGAAGNGAGRVTRVDDGARTQQFTYDKAGAIATETTTMKLRNGPSPVYTTSLTRDWLGRLLTLTYPDGEVLTHQYDSGGLLSSMQGTRTLGGTALVNNYLKRQEYDEFQNKRYRQLGNNTTTEWTYDPQTRRLARLKTDTPTRTVQDLNYLYDRTGNVLEMDNRLPNPTSSQQAFQFGWPTKQTYTYDPFYRVKSAIGTARVAFDTRRDYTYTVTYDARGNLRSKEQVDTATTVPGGSPRRQTATSYKFDPMAYSATKPNQLTNSGTSQGPTSAAGTYSYDDNGNLTRVSDARSRVKRVNSWSAENKLDTIAPDTSTRPTEFRYDALGLLGSLYSPPGDQEIVFVNEWYQTAYNGLNYRQIWAGDERLAQVTDQLNPTTGEIRRYHFYLHADLQGSVNLETDWQAIVTKHFEYFPSGEVWIEENNPGAVYEPAYRFLGRYYNEDVKLYNPGQRWYEPREQFFYSPEPLLYDDPESVIADPALLPAYAYAQFNPLRLYDDDGLAPKNVQVKLSAAANANPGKALTAALDAKRDSRLWQSLVKLALTERGDKLQALNDRFEAKPLLEIELANVGGRPKLKSISGGFFIWQKTLKEWATGPTTTPQVSSPTLVSTTNTQATTPLSTAQSNANKPPRPTKPLPPLPPKATGQQTTSANNTTASTTSTSPSTLPPRPSKPLPPIPVKSNSKPPQPSSGN